MADVEKVTDSKKFLKFILSKILPITISLGIIIGFCIYENNLLMLIKIFPTLNFFYLLLAFVCIFSSWIFESKSLKLFFTNIYSGSLDYFKLAMIGTFYGSMTPFDSGKQSSQTVKLMQVGVTPGKAISSFGKKLFASQICTVLLSLICIIFKFNEFNHKVTGFMFFIVCGLLMQCLPLGLLILFFFNTNNIMKLVFWFYKILQKIKIIKNSEKLKEKTIKQLNFLLENKFTIPIRIDVYVYAFLQILLYNLVPFFIAKAFGLDGFPILSGISGQVFITLISQFSPLPGSSGLAETNFIKILNNFFSSKNIAPAMLLNRFIVVYFGMIIGSIFSFTKIKNKKNKNQ
ncbi:MAG: flippase-like domain-containing protein [Candidatus Improbicoccus devescovinae]|nr:MAG: flippase-like domain-containing protein [Candidatus Improbicoccus devescovinae]